MNTGCAKHDYISNRYGFRRVLELHAADILRPDIGSTGDIREAKKITTLAEVYNMRIQPHTAAARQLDACLTNFFIHEL